MLPRVPTGHANLVVLDLPYGTTNAEFDGVILRSTRGSKSVVPLGQLWAELDRVVATNGVVLAFASQPFTSVMVMSNYRHYKYSWIWVKNRCANAVAARYAPLKIYEEVLVFSRAGANTNARVPIPYYPQNLDRVGQIKYRASEVAPTGVYRYNSLSRGEYTSLGTNFPTALLHYPVPSGKSRVHATQKPVSLLRYLIATYSEPGQVVLDPLMGSGSTGVAALRCGRRFVGIELDKQTFEIAQRRIVAAGEKF